MSIRIRNIILYIIGFIFLVIFTYYLYHLGINIGRLIHSFI